MKDEDGSSALFDTKKSFQIMIQSLSIMVSMLEKYHANPKESSEKLREIANLTEFTEFDNLPSFQNFESSLFSILNYIVGQIQFVQDKQIILNALVDLRRIIISLFDTWKNSIILEDNKFISQAAVSSQMDHLQMINKCIEADKIMMNAMFDTVEELNKSQITTTQQLVGAINKIAENVIESQRKHNPEQSSQNTSIGSSTTQAALPSASQPASASTLPPLPAPKQRNYTLLTAIHKFKAEAQNIPKKQLAFNQGDQLRVFKTYRNGPMNGWLKAKNAQDEEGVVPSNYLQQQM